MFLGINIVWTLLRAHFNPRLTARAKMSLDRAQNIFMPANMHSIVLIELLILKINLCAVVRESYKREVGQDIKC